MEDFQCWIVEKDGDAIKGGLHTVDSIQESDVLIRTRYSSLNFKDALASQGHPGVVRNFPQVPGIDCVGEVVESRDPQFKPGDQVLVGHADFGTSYPGGWSGFASVPADWVLKIPEGLTPFEVITLGTAGFTAAGCVEALQRSGVKPENGPVAVTGATGGVGIFSIMLLNKLGYEVAASTGKPEKEAWLKNLGATQVIGRDAFSDTSDRPLLKGIWAGGVDTVGGNTLGTFLRSTQIGGAVSACGVVAGPELPVTVYPFILRGVSLCGIDSANTSRDNRIHLWNLLAGEWRLDHIESLSTVVPFDGLNEQIENILAGKVAGRVVVEME